MLDWRRWVCRCRPRDRGARGHRDGDLMKGPSRQRGSTCSRAAAWFLGGARPVGAVEMAFNELPRHSFDAVWFRGTRRTFSWPGSRPSATARNALRRDCGPSLDRWLGTRQGCVCVAGPRGGSEPPRIGIQTAATPGQARHERVRNFLPRRPGQRLDRSGRKAGHLVPRVTTG